MNKKLVGIIVATSLVFGGTVASAELDTTTTSTGGVTVTSDPGTGGHIVPNAFVDPGTGGH